METLPTYLFLYNENPSQRSYKIYHSTDLASAVIGFYLAIGGSRYLSVDDFAVLANRNAENAIHVLNKVNDANVKINNIVDNNGYYLFTRPKGE